eukprot:403348695
MFKQSLNGQTQKSWNQRIGLEKPGANLTRCIMKDLNCGSMKPLRTMHQSSKPNQGHSQRVGAVQVCYEGDRILLKIAKNQLNKIKIKHTHKSTIINNFHEIINLLQSKESHKLENPTNLSQEDSVKPIQHDQLMPYDLNEIKPNPENEQANLDTVIDEFQAQHLHQKNMIRIQLGTSSSSKEKENLLNVEHSTSSMEASTQIDTTTTKSYQETFKINGLIHDDLSNNNLSAIKSEEENNVSAVVAPPILPNHQDVEMSFHENISQKKFKNGTIDLKSRQNLQSGCDYGNLKICMRLPCQSSNLQQAQSSHPTYLKWQKFSLNESATDLWTNHVYVSYKSEWEGLYITDHFLWPKSNRSVQEMKQFAALFLAEYLGTQEFRKYENHQIERPGQCLGQGQEHLVEINLDICWDKWNLKDQFTWDISNPDNSPEEFSCQLVNDLQLPNVFTALVSLQIRRQIQNYALKCAQMFKDGCANDREYEMPITQTLINSNR